MEARETWARLLTINSLARLDLPQPPRIGLLTFNSYTIELPNEDKERYGA